MGIQVYLLIASRHSLIVGEVSQNEKRSLKQQSKQCLKTGLVVVNEQDWVEFMHLVKHILAAHGGYALHGEDLHSDSSLYCVVLNLSMCHEADWKTIKPQSAC